MIPYSSKKQQIAVIFDLDKTITRFDTYVSFLILVLLQRPHRMIFSLLLPFAVITHKCRLKDNAWLKTIFLRTIVGGANQNQVEKWANQFVAKIISKGISSKALKAIEQHKRLGHKLILASASFDFYVTRLGKQLGFNEIICTASSWNERNQLTGKIKGYNCYGKAKLNRVQEYFGNERNQWYIIGYSDHHSDEPMLEWVDQPIAVNPTVQLNQTSRCRGYDIQKW